MKNILINGVSAKSAGGRSILTNLLRSIANKSASFNYIVIVPAGLGYEQYSNSNIVIIPYSDGKFSFLRQIYFYFYFVKRTTKTYQISLIFNLADVIVPLRIKQLFLFDWPYAVYPESLVWSKMDFFELIYRKVKLSLFKRYIRYPISIYAQTDSVKKRLENLYQLNNLSIIPNAVSLDNFDGGTFKDFGLPPDRFKFLCLCKYYVHKNLEVLVPVARLIRLYNLPFSIIITLEKNHHKRAENLLSLISREGLHEIIINVGEVHMKHIPSLYKQSNALLLPTQLESFSGTYVEAMYHHKPIFTSDIDFARDVCGDAAIYFDPEDPKSILNELMKISDNSLIENLIQSSSIRLTSFLTWEDVSNKVLEEINRSI